MPFDDDDRWYLVLQNPEGQYSLWPADLKIPEGWDVTEFSGNRKDCVEHLETAWSDMRPASLVAA